MFETQQHALKFLRCYSSIFFSVPSGAEYISPRAVATSSTSLNISWYRPRYPNGIITRYDIYRYESSDLSTAILTASSSGAGLSSVVNGLKPYTSYQISVKACNSKGCTGFSSRATISTLADGKILIFLLHKYESFNTNSSQSSY